MLSYSINVDQIKKLKKIHQTYTLQWEKLDSFSAEKKSFIKRHSIISNIGASTRIENALLTNVEIDWVDTELSKEANITFGEKEDFIKNKLSKDKERSIEEVAGYRDALEIVYDSYKDFTVLRESDIKGLHRELMKYYSNADYHRGNYKTQINSVVEINSITGKKRKVMVTADPGIITQTSMADLVRWYNKTINREPWVLTVSVEFVFRFLAIHPFQDGNGRLSRLLFQLILMNSEDEYFSNLIPYLALDREIEKTRSEYYLVLRKCSGGLFNIDPTRYNYNFFLDYMLKVITNSVDNISFYSQKFEDYNSLSETDIKIYNCFKEKPEKNLQTKDIVGELTIPRRTAIYSLNKLVDRGFLQIIGKGAGVRYKLVF